MESPTTVTLNIPVDGTAPEPDVGVVSGPAVAVGALVPATSVAPEHAPTPLSTRTAPTTRDHRERRPATGWPWFMRAILTHDVDVTARARPAVF
ncbi:MAG TPA: hypothetical protein VGN28_15600 [Blastococcus sp.]|jgi:hypothetical protein|nr:hypothetical protein [Blastococcus sp.]